MKTIFNPNPSFEAQHGGLFVAIPQGYSDHDDEVADRLVLKHGGRGIRHERRAGTAAEEAAEAAAVEEAGEPEEAQEAPEPETTETTEATEATETLKPKRASHTAPPAHRKK